MMPIAPAPTIKTVGIGDVLLGISAPVVECGGTTAGCCADAATLQLTDSVRILPMWSGEVGGGQLALG
ncbi:hypothetical protein GCM10017566_47660 [Amycolatopsis bartoniae]|uniref:Uncharacterized protein n=1 Tax=Amycolatopsis bartoniae TaxID=941986 RepID=A0A8H9J3A0_9PSEU|nr:hypothetical protein GCM10017566_47660 [Amycolatopsis bartoniae]